MIEKYIIDYQDRPYRYSEIVKIKCYYCKGIYEIPYGKLEIKFKGKYLVEIQTCKNKECLNSKQRDIIIYRKQVGESIALGCKHSEESIKKGLETIRERFPDGTQSHRKGKSHIEQYGKEKAEEMRKINSETTKQQFKEKGHPMQDKKHKEESKLLQSQSKRKFLDGGASHEKKYIHPITGELLDWWEWQSEIKILAWSNKSIEEKEAYCEKFTNLFLDRDGNFIMRSKTGYISHWLLEKDQKFESSYEEAYFNKCNDEKLYWKKNYTIYIPYMHPIKKERRFYVPDILIFNDSNFNNIETIVEIKPNKFVENKKNYKSDYFEITKAKLEALKTYCNSNNYNYLIITENELGEYLEN